MGSSSKRSSVLIIDDERVFAETLGDELADRFGDIAIATTAAEGLALCKHKQVDVVLLDQRLPDGTGAELCPKILDLDDSIKIIFMTAYPSFEAAVAALRAGAHDFLSKPVEIEEVYLAVKNAMRLLELERIEQLANRRTASEMADAVMIGATGDLHEAVRLADLSAEAEAPVLITGETGTGKSALARYIHYRSSRQHRPLVTLNCAALPETLAESELFGHEKGAFTGASGVRRGVFEMATGGSVLLDEIGAMPLALQAKLLGVLEDRTVRRIGGETERRVDVRVIAATNSDLEAMAQERSFRQDLFFRLCVLHIWLPPLRARPNDLPDLCRHLLTTIAQDPPPLADGELERLATYDWPGNVRELRNILERTVIVQRGCTRLTPSELLTRASSAPAPPQQLGLPATDGVVTLHEAERQLIEKALEACSGNLTQTARTLGVALSTLKRKLDRYGLR